MVSFRLPSILAEISNSNKKDYRKKYNRKYLKAQNSRYNIELENRESPREHFVELKIKREQWKDATTINKWNPF